MGARGAATNDVTFDDVEIPFSNVMGGENGWNKGWSFLVGPGMDTEKLEVAAMALGIAAAAVDDAWQYSTERQQFGKAISSVQSIRHMLADAQTKLHACRLVMTQAAWLADNHLPCRAETSMAKLFVCDTAKDIVLKCQMVMGAYGYVEDTDMERYVRDVLLMPIIGGSSAIQLNNIASAFQLPK
jgi:alkylation response protein AidB-like acyl-CoA dehydrogenase